MTATAASDGQAYGRIIARRRQCLLESVSAKVWWMHSEIGARSERTTGVASWGKRVRTTVRMIP